jgi:hypothetical protein
MVSPVWRGALSDPLAPCHGSAFCGYPVLISTSLIFQSQGGTAGSRPKTTSWKARRLTDDQFFTSIREWTLGTALGGQGIGKKFALADCAKNPAKSVEL